MSLIEIARANPKLQPSPIVPSWIIEGSPQAHAAVMSKSTCGSAWTMIWSCSEGKFNWYYDVDETIMILEGSIVLEIEGMPPTRYGAGDVILFREGSHAKWHVEGHVKKVAFFRRANPRLLDLPIRAINKIKRLSRRRLSPLSA